MRLTAHSPPGSLPRVSLARLAGTFALVGATSFGGGLTGYIRRTLVEDRRWLTDDEFLEGFSVAQAVPGPNAVNLAIFAGWRLNGSAGAAVAVAAVMFVPLLFVSALAAGWSAWAAQPHAAGVMKGLGAFGVGILASSGLSMLRAARFRGPDLLLALAAFLCVAMLGFSVPAVLFGLAALSALRPRGADAERTP